ncbi:hypothetical protein GCM10010390_85850 [Streptomyces mordarskii]|uniref:Uncharacterized protein n=1 Tax=Streptomyces mordarskii TaxID=1226758 RepID=A0ABN1ENS6_9ACTN
MRGPARMPAATPAAVGVQSVIQSLAVQLQLAQLTMPVTLEVLMVGDVHLVRPPELGELGAGLQQRCDDRHTGQRGYLLAPQPTGTTPGATGKPDILRLQRLPACPEKVGQQYPVHLSLPCSTEQASREPGPG